METKYSTDFHIAPGLSYQKTNNAKKLLPLNPNQVDQISVIFVYGSDFPRRFILFDTGLFWNGTCFWIFCGVLVVAAIILYQLRRVAGLQCVSFLIGFLEVFVVVFGGGNIRAQHLYEKVFFAIMLVASFFLVSIYLADFSMHSVFYQPQRVNTFDELAKRNVTFYSASRLAEYESEITGMLR